VLFGENQKVIEQVKKEIPVFHKKSFRQEFMVLYYQGQKVMSSGKFLSG